MPILACLTSFLLALGLVGLLGSNAHPTADGARHGAFGTHPARVATASSPRPADRIRPADRTRRGALLPSLNQVFHPSFTLKYNDYAR